MTYNEFIQDIIDTRGQWNIPKGEYYENHHIIPICMGGEPKNYDHDTIHENLIWLTPEEHYKAHELLFYENLWNSSLAHAWWNMCVWTRKGRSTIIDSEYYGILKRQRSKLISINQSGENHYLYNHGELISGSLNPFYGKKHSAESKVKMGAKSVLCVETGEIFVSLHEAAEWCNGGADKICLCCQGKRNKHRGYHWQYIN